MRPPLRRTMRIRALTLQSSRTPPARRRWTPLAGPSISAMPTSTDRPTASIAAQSVTWTAADQSDMSASLTAGEVNALEHALTLAQAGNTNNGTVDWTYAIADHALDFIGAGQTVTVASTVAIDDRHGGVVDVPVTVTITGAEDAPVITPRSQSAGSDRDPGQVADRACSRRTHQFGRSADRDLRPCVDKSGLQQWSWPWQLLQRGAARHVHGIGMTPASCTTRPPVSAAPYVARRPGPAPIILASASTRRRPSPSTTRRTASGLYWGSVDSYNSISTSTTATSWLRPTRGDDSAAAGQRRPASFASNGYVEFLGPCAVRQGRAGQQPECLRARQRVRRLHLRFPCQAREPDRGHADGQRQGCRRHADGLGDRRCHRQVQRLDTCRRMSTSMR